MKKIILSFCLFSFIVGNVCAKDDFGPNRRLKSGFWLKMGYNATFPKFFYPENHIGEYNDKAADLGLNFQLGTTFYIGPRIADMLRFGLDAGWLDLSYFKLSSDYQDNASAYFLRIFEVGPIISFSPARPIAFDCYYRVVPTYSLMYHEAPGVDGDHTSYAYHGYRTNSLLGVTFRVGVLSLGAEYNFGKLKYTDIEDDTNKTDLLYISNLRLLLGFKF